jgi:hypothetical protein
MGQLLSFSVRFPYQLLQTHVMLEKLLKTNLNKHFRPKIGMLNVNGIIYKFGIPDTGAQLLEGEQIVVPGMTALPGYLDRTTDIVNILAQFPKISSCFTEFFGETSLEFIYNNEIKKEWISRYGKEDSLNIIERFRISQFSQTTFLIITVYCPWLFLKKWWPEDGLPNYATPETAEHNWDELINIIQSVINVFGIDDLEKTMLSFEGSGPGQESKWLIAHANRLPKLEVDFA